jgi:NAD(P)-dependent dehydrogenase (short-subunit alcohol dehydrogenase family)
LSGKVVLITGASQGIGAGIAAALLREGCRLRLVARDGAKLQKLAETITARYATEVCILALDLRSDGATAPVTEWAGDADILINNVGGTEYGDLWSVDNGRWAANFRLKFFTAVDLTRLFYPRMKHRGNGVILNNIGTLSEISDPNFVIGTSVCAAMVAFTRSLGSTSMKDGIRVLGISPGAVDTPLLRSMATPELMNNLPGARAASIAEIADLFVFLASPRSGYTSGTVVTVDGGQSARATIS